MKRILILAVTLMLAGCSAPAEKSATEKAADPQADKAAVDKVRDDFIAAFNAGDATKIADLYAENAVALPGDGPTVQGRAGILDRNKGLFDQFTAKVTITPTDTRISGDLAVDQGTYTMAMTPKAKGGKPMTEEGRYVVVLYRDGGAWKVVTDMDNKVGKPAAAPAAAKAPASPAKKATAPATKRK